MKIYLCAILSLLAISRAYGEQVTIVDYLIESGFTIVDANRKISSKQVSKANLKLLGEAGVRRLIADDFEVSLFSFSDKLVLLGDLEDEFKTIMEVEVRKSSEPIQVLDILSEVFFSLGFSWFPSTVEQINPKMLREKIEVDKSVKFREILPSILQITGARYFSFCIPENNQGSLKIVEIEFY